MLDNKTGLHYYNYRLELENIVLAICNLCFDIGVQIDNKEFNEDYIPMDYAKELFITSFLNDVGIDVSRLEKDETTKKYQYNKDDFFSKIVNYYNTKLFFLEDFLEKIDGSDIVFIDKNQTFLITTDEKGRTIKGRIVSSIRESKILENIISQINSDKIKRSLEQINLLEHSAIYGKTIKLIPEGSLQPALPFLNYDFLNEEKVIKEEEDYENFWINRKYFEEHNITDIKIEDIAVLKSKEDKKTIGYVFGKHFLPYNYSAINIESFISKNHLFEFYWGLFNYSYSKKLNTRSHQASSLTSEFREKIKDKKLNITLSHLKNNLYIPSSISLESEYKKFFEEVVLLENLEHVKEYDFIVSQNENQLTAIGLYSKEKKGTSYNLLHWLDHDTEVNLKHHRDSQPKNKKKHLVYALKPEISFYFLEKYYEDLLESILKQNEYEYISNFSLSSKKINFDCEVDFLVKGKDKFYYIEAKTKLTKNYIEEFTKKASRVLSIFSEAINEGIEIEFLLLSSFSDNTVNDFRYFINKSKVEDYNEKRGELNSIPYKFNVPIPDKDKEIICFAEPEYKRLNKILLELCPK